MRALHGTFAITLLLTCGLRGEQLPQSLFGDVVTFRLPSHWQLQRHFTKTNSTEVLQLLIPDPDTDKTPDSSNVVITAEQSSPGATLDSYKERAVGSPARGFLTTTEILGGKNWLSRLSHGMQGKTHYIVVDRLGLDRGCFVYFRAACPLIDRKDREWMGNFVASCNSVIKSLKIGGKNVITSELKLDAVEQATVVWLRDLNDPAKHFDYRTRE